MAFAFRKKEPEPAPRADAARKDTFGPHEPERNVFRVCVPPESFGLFRDSQFAKLLLLSSDGKFALSVVMKNDGTFLSLVPRSMPSVRLKMEASDFRERFVSGMLIEVSDGCGRTKGFEIAAVKPLELMDSGDWAERKRHQS